MLMCLTSCTLEERAGGNDDQRDGFHARTCRFQKSTLADGWVYDMFGTKKAGRTSRCHPVRLCRLAVALDQVALDRLCRHAVALDRLCRNAVALIRDLLQRLNDIHPRCTTTFLLYFAAASPDSSLPIAHLSSLCCHATLICL